MHDACYSVSPHCGSLLLVYIHAIKHAVLLNWLACASKDLLQTHCWFWKSLEEKQMRARKESRESVVCLLITITATDRLFSWGTIITDWVIQTSCVCLLWTAFFTWGVYMHLWMASRLKSSTTFWCLEILYRLAGCWMSVPLMVHSVSSLVIADSHIPSYVVKLKLKHKTFPIASPQYKVHFQGASYVLLSTPQALSHIFRSLK